MEILSTALLSLCLALQQSPEARRAQAEGLTSRLLKGEASVSPSLIALGRDAIGPLERALRKTDRGASIPLFETLVAIGPEAAPAIARFVVRKGPDYVFLGRLASADEKTIERVVRDAAGIKPGGISLVIYLYGLMPILRDGGTARLTPRFRRQAVATLIDAFSKPDEGGAVRASVYLAGYPGEALGPLIALSGHKSPEMRIWAAKSLSRIQSQKGLVTIDWLTRDPNPQVRRVASNCHRFAIKLVELNQARSNRP